MVEAGRRNHLMLPRYLQKPDEKFGPKALRNQTTSTARFKQNRRMMNCPGGSNRCKIPRLDHPVEASITETSRAEPGLVAGESPFWDFFFRGSSPLSEPGLVGPAATDDVLFRFLRLGGCNKSRLCSRGFGCGCFYGKVTGLIYRIAPESRRGVEII